MNGTYFIVTPQMGLALQIIMIINIANFFRNAADKGQHFICDFKWRRVLIHRAFSHPTCYLAYFPAYYTMSAIAAIVWLRPDAQHILRFRRICFMRRYNSHSAAIIPHLQDKSRTGPLLHNQIRVKDPCF